MEQVGQGEVTAGADLESPRIAMLQSQLISQPSSSLSPLPFCFIWQSFFPGRIWCQCFQNLHCLDPCSSSNWRAPARAPHSRKIPTDFECFDFSTYLPVPRTQNRYLSSTNMKYFQSFWYFSPCFSIFSKSALPQSLLFQQSEGTGQSPSQQENTLTSTPIYQSQRLKLGIWAQQTGNISSPLGTFLPAFLPVEAQLSICKAGWQSQH